jgi:hypothetical protein
MRVIALPFSSDETVASFLKISLTWEPAPRPENE